MQTVRVSIVVAWALLLPLFEIVQVPTRVEAVQLLDSDSDSSDEVGLPSVAKEFQDVLTSVGDHIRHDLLSPFIKEQEGPAAAPAAAPSAATPTVASAAPQAQEANRLAQADSAAAAEAQEGDSTTTSTPEPQLTPAPEPMRLDSNKSNRPLKEVLPWYHSAQEILDTLMALQTTCKLGSLEVTSLRQDDVYIPLVKITGRDEAKRSPNRKKAMFFFGVHGREIIGPEAGLDFVQSLCGTEASSANAANVTNVGDLLNKVDFTIVPNANPLGRLLVEKGAFCHRTNERGVDLNRNFAVGGGPRELKGQETNPGPMPFSEPESHILRGLVDREKPDVFVDVHAGALAFGSSWGYTEEPKDGVADDAILKPLAEKFCNGKCAYGNLAKVVGYLASGTIMDYVSQTVETPYAYTFEIFLGNTSGHDAHAAAKAAKAAGMLDVSEQEKGAKVQVVNERAQHQGLLGEGEYYAADGSPVNAETDWTVQQCLNQFTPQTEDETTQVVKTWSAALVEVCSRMLEFDMARKAGQPAAR